jgi:hypothetical protein
MNDLCRLSNFLANFLPLIVFIFFDRVEESHTLLECQ